MDLVKVCEVTVSQVIPSDVQGSEVKYLTEGKAFEHQSIDHLTLMILKEE